MLNVVNIEKNDKYLVTFDITKKEGDSLLISGWLFNKKNSKPAESISIRQGFRIIKAVCGISRPDLLDAFKGEYSKDILNAGFTFSVPASKINLMKPVSLVIYEQDAAAVTLSGVKLWLRSGKFVSDSQPHYRQLEDSYCLERASEAVSNFSCCPLITFVFSSSGANKKMLSASIDSIKKQYYQNWELLIVGVESDSLLAGLQPDDRIRMLPQHGASGLWSSLNYAIKNAKGEYVTVLDEATRLAPFFLYEMIVAINRDGEKDVIYSDEDRIDKRGERHFPHFKPDWSLDQFLSQMYVGDVCLFRMKLVRDVGGFRDGFAGALFYDLILRILSFRQDATICHIPLILYHSFSGSSKVKAVCKRNAQNDSSSMKALSDYIHRENIDAEVKLGLIADSYRIKYGFSQKPSVAIIVPTKDHVSDLQILVDSLLSKTSQSVSYRLYLIDNQSRAPETVNYYNELEGNDQVSIITTPFEEFNFSKIINYAVSQTDEPYVLFLNNDMEIVDADWLSAMQEHIERPGVGAVGARLLYPGGKQIQHAGIILDVREVAGHSHKRLQISEAGHHGRPHVIGNYTGVTGACLLTTRDMFIEVNGFDEENLAVGYNDVDFCLKITHEGQRIVYTPHATLIHYESKSRKDELDSAEEKQAWDEVRFIRNKWRAFLEKGDPFYNENLSRKNEDFSLRYDA